MYLFLSGRTDFFVYVYTPGRRQSKTLIKIVFSIAIRRQSGDKCQSKTIAKDFDLRLSIVLTFSVAAYPLWCMPFLDFVAKHDFIA